MHAGLHGCVGIGGGALQGPTGHCVCHGAGGVARRLAHVRQVDGNANDIDGIDMSSKPACYQLLKGDKRIVQFTAAAQEDIVGHVTKVWRETACWGEVPLRAQTVDVGGVKARKSRYAKNLDDL